MGNSISTQGVKECMSNRRFVSSLLMLITLATASQAATLKLYVARMGLGDKLEYRLPGKNWVRIENAYWLATVYNVPNNVIVVARVYNIYQGRTISQQAKATWPKSQGGDADRNGNVIFQLNGIG